MQSLESIFKKIIALTKQLNECIKKEDLALCPDLLQERQKLLSLSKSRIEELPQSSQKVQFERQFIDLMTDIKSQDQSANEQLMLAQKSLIAEHSAHRKGKKAVKQYQSVLGG